MGEAIALTIAGILLGLGMLYAMLLVMRPYLESYYGLHITLGSLTTHELFLMGLVLLAGSIVGLLPSYRAYKLSLSDGLSIRI